MEDRFNDATEPTDRALLMIEHGNVRMKECSGSNKADSVRTTTDAVSPTAKGSLIYESFDAAKAAGAVHVVRIDTRKQDDGTHLTGVLYMDFYTFKHSKVEEVGEVRKSVATAMKGPLESRPEVLDLTCDLPLSVFKRQQSFVVAARDSDSHDCWVVGFGGHGRGEVFGGDGGTSPTHVDDIGTDTKSDELHPPAVAGRYLPAITEVDGLVLYRVDLRLELTSPSTTAGRELPFEESRKPGCTYYFMPAERLVIDLLHRSELLRLRPFERRDMLQMKSRLDARLSTSSVNGTPASLRVFVAGGHDDSGSWELFKRSATSGGSSSGKATAVLFIGEIIELHSDSDGKLASVRFAGMRADIPIAAELELGAVKRLRGRARAARRSAHERFRVLGVAIFKLNPDGTESMVRFGSLLMSGSYMFAESFGEADESTRMYAAGVDHEKCVERLPSYGFVPDFLAHGYRYPVVVERWGLLTPEYREHMEKKISAATGVLPIVHSDAANDPHGLPKYPDAISEAIRRHEEFQRSRLPDSIVPSPACTDPSAAAAESEATLTGAAAVLLPELIESVAGQQCSLEPKSAVRAQKVVSLLRSFTALIKRALRQVLVG